MSEVKSILCVNIHFKDDIWMAVMFKPTTDFSAKEMYEQYLKRIFSNGFIHVNDELTLPAHQIAKFVVKQIDWVEEV